MTIRILVGVLSILTAFAGARVQAQDSWVQIEARPTLALAEERAQAYSGAFPDVAGFALASGWFAIALGPYPAAQAPARLAELRNERLIPDDSFIADGRKYGRQFWPAASDAPADPELQVALAPDPVPEPASAPAAPVDETPEEARAAEAALPLADRQELQAALQWFGFYNAAIDGAIGPGTRSAIAAWQEASEAEPTGVLTTRQRAALVSAHLAAQAEFGLERVTDVEAGIEIDLPMAMVQFDHYEPPFVHYSARDGSGVSVLLISQPGDQSTLYGLYDILQTLEIVPPGGARSRDDRSFTIEGQNDRIESYTYAELKAGLVKGYTLVWPSGDAARKSRVLDAMKSSFKPIGDRALDPGLAPMPEDQRKGLLSGLEVRRPVLSRSGFFIDADGTVLTTTEVLKSCNRITIDGGQEMDLRLSDPATGLAVLTPQRQLAPTSFASFQKAPERLGAEIVVAGYPFEDRLAAPTLTFGTLDAAEGLNGEPGLKQMTMPVLAGDAGGPVIDGTGAVIGMLLPRETGGPRKLPENVVFAAAASAIAARLAAEGITLGTSESRGALPPEDLTLRATGMTVLVSCWN